MGRAIKESKVVQWKLQITMKPSSTKFSKALFSRKIASIVCFKQAQKLWQIYLIFNNY